MPVNVVCVGIRGDDKPTNIVLEESVTVELFKQQLKPQLVSQNQHSSVNSPSKHKYCMLCLYIVSRRRVPLLCWGAPD